MELKTKWDCNLCKYAQIRPNEMPCRCCEVYSLWEAIEQRLSMLLPDKECANCNQAKPLAMTQKWWCMKENTTVCANDVCYSWERFKC
jgi:hypothetical protein